NRFLQSTHPIAADSHSSLTCARVSEAKIEYIGQGTSHKSVCPGSDLAMRVRSVIALLIFLMVSSSVSAILMSLPYDFPIFCPSTPFKRGTAVNSGLGSGKYVTANMLLNRRAMSRANSRCDSWSLPTGTGSPLKDRMSACIGTG